jgi:hypothetical protein
LTHDSIAVFVDLGTYLSFSCFWLFIPHCVARTAFMLKSALLGNIKHWGALLRERIETTNYNSMRRGRGDLRFSLGSPTASVVVPCTIVVTVILIVRVRGRDAFMWLNRLPSHFLGPRPRPLMRAILFKRKLASIFYFFCNDTAFIDRNINLDPTDSGFGRRLIDIFLCFGNFRDRHELSGLHNYSG